MYKKTGGVIVALIIKIMRGLVSFELRFVRCVSRKRVVPQCTINKYTLF